MIEIVNVNGIINLIITIWIALMLTVQSVALLLLLPLIRQTAKNSEVYKKLFGIKDETKG